MVSPIPRTRTRLTGQARYRRQAITGRLVLQLEELQETSTHLRCPPPPGCNDFRGWLARQEKEHEASWRPWRARWRDATLRDLLDGHVPPTSTP